MTRLALPLALAPLLLASCAAETHDVGTRCAGPVSALNPDQWHPTASDMQALQRACQETRDHG